MRNPSILEVVEFKDKLVEALTQNAFIRVAHKDIYSLLKLKLNFKI